MLHMTTSPAADIPMYDSDAQHELRRPTVDVAQTIDSGQVFLWDEVKKDGSTKWYGINGQDILRIDVDGTVSAYRNGRWPKYKKDFFRSGDDINAVYKTLPVDSTMASALRRYPGLRIMRQDPFQCLISFIVSANSNISRIRTNLADIAQRFGRCTDVKGVKRFYTFPEPVALAGASVQDVQKCGVGYRAKYVVEAAGMIASNAICLDDIARMHSYDDAMDAMLAIPGVGNKVADCAMLFSLERADAFPLDRWMMRVLHQYYGDVINAAGSAKGQPETPAHLTDKRYRMAHRRITEYFGPHAGYAQQLLFKMARDDAGGRMAPKKPLKPHRGASPLGL